MVAAAFPTSVLLNDLRSMHKVLKDLSLEFGYP